MSLLDFEDVVHSNPPRTARNGPEAVNSHYNVLNVEEMADAIAVVKRAMRAGLTAICFVLPYSSFSGTRSSQEQG